jgi:hypothetical protein
MIKIYLITFAWIVLVLLHGFGRVVVVPASQLHGSIGDHGVVGEEAAGIALALWF